METEKGKYLFYLIGFLCLFSFSFAQSNDTVNTADTTQYSLQEIQKIQLRTYVESSKVPQNRPVIFHVELSWPGDLSRYRIEPVSQPILTNLILEGSGSENRLEPLENGKFKAIKSLTYRFKPLEMGMAYIDGVTVKYVDSVTGKEDRLTSQRVMVEIVEPLPDQGQGGVKSFVFLFLIIAFLVILGYFLFMYFKKKKEARQAIEPVVPLSEIYLNRLAQEVDPRGTNLDEMVTRLSKIFREYLDQEYGIRSRESSTSEIIEQLQKIEMDESSRMNLEMVFKKLDLIKFAGKNIDPADFTNIYGTIETFLLKQKESYYSTQAGAKEA